MNRFPIKHAWRKSTFCNGADACVEVALLADGSVVVRDEHGGLLQVPAKAWQAFLDAVKCGLLGAVGGLVMCRRVSEDVWNVWLASDYETALLYTEREMAAFWDGVHGGEFDLEALGAGDGSGVDARSEGASAAVAGSGGGSVPA